MLFILSPQWQDEQQLQNDNNNNNNNQSNNNNGKKKILIITNNGNKITKQTCLGMDPNTNMPHNKLSFWVLKNTIGKCSGTIFF